MIYLLINTFNGVSERFQAENEGLDQVDLCKKKILPPYNASNAQISMPVIFQTLFCRLGFIIYLCESIFEGVRFFLQIHVMS